MVIIEKRTERIKLWLTDKELKQIDRKAGKLGMNRSEHIRHIIEKLQPFEDHPYKVLDNESMTELVESIKEYGLLNRIIVRPLEDKPDE